MLLLFFSFFLTSFSQSVIYIGNTTLSTCTTDKNCNGTRAKPYKSFIDGISQISLRIAELQESELWIILLSESNYITDKDFSELNTTQNSKLYNSTLARYFLFNFTKVIKNIIIMPNECFETKNCNFRTKIAVKTEKFSFLVPSTLLIKNIVFDGLDLNLVYVETLHASCIRTPKGCCNEQVLENLTNTSCPTANISKPTVTYKEGVLSDAFSLFNFQINGFLPNGSQTLTLENCLFYHINSVKRSTFQIFSSLISFGLNNQTCAIQKQKNVYIRNSTFFKNYFKNGLINITSCNYTIVLEKSKFDRYNHYFFDETPTTTEKFIFRFFSIRLLNSSHNSLLVVNDSFHLMPIKVTRIFVLDQINMTMSANIFKAITQYPFRTVVLTIFDRATLFIEKMSALKMDPYLNRTFYMLQLIEINSPNGTITMKNNYLKNLECANLCIGRKVSTTISTAFSYWNVSFFDNYFENITANSYFFTCSQSNNINMTKNFFIRLGSNIKTAIIVRGGLIKIDLQNIVSMQYIYYINKTTYPIPYFEFQNQNLVNVSDSVFDRDLDYSYYSIFQIDSDNTFLLKNVDVKHIYSLRFMSMRMGLSGAFGTVIYASLTNRIKISKPKKKIKLNC